MFDSLCRYVSAVEAAMRIYKYPLHREAPSVVRLAVHLPDQHMVLFNETDALEDIESRPPRTTLTQWFAANNDAIVGPSARHLLYVDFPQFFTWRGNKWHPRKKNIGRCGPSIGRLYLTNPGKWFLLELFVCLF